MSIDIHNHEVISGLAKATQEEKVNLELSLERERQWYQDYPIYSNDEDIEKAIASGVLVELYNSTNIRRLPRFNKVAGFTPYLTRQAWQMAHDFSEIWRETMWDNNGYFNDSIRLAATSMVRSQVYQDLLIKDTDKLASLDSRHCIGAAIDFDASGYYSISKTGSVMSLTDPRRHEKQKSLSQKIKQRFGNDTPSELASANMYQQYVMDCAVEAAQQMHNDGKVNFIHEFKGTENACIHMAVNPDY